MQWNKPLMFETWKIRHAKKELDYPFVYAFIRSYTQFMGILSLQVIVCVHRNTFGYWKRNTCGDQCYPHKNKKSNLLVLQKQRVQRLDTKRNDNTGLQQTSYSVYRRVWQRETIRHVHTNTRVCSSGYSPSSRNSQCSWPPVERLNISGNSFNLLSIIKPLTDFICLTNNLL